MFTANFFKQETDDQGAMRFEARLAAALDIDQSRKVLDFHPEKDLFRMSPARYAEPEYPTTWQDSQWVSFKGEDSSPHTNAMSFSPNFNAIKQAQNQSLKSQEQYRLHHSDKLTVLRP